MRRKVEIEQASRSVGVAVVFRAGGVRSKSPVYVDHHAGVVGECHLGRGIVDAGYRVTEASIVVEAGTDLDLRAVALIDELNIEVSGDAG